MTENRVSIACEQLGHIACTGTYFMGRVQVACYCTCHRKRSKSPAAAPDQPSLMEASAPGGGSAHPTSRRDDDDSRAECNRPAPGEYAAREVEGLASSSKSRSASRPPASSNVEPAGGTLPAAEKPTEDTLGVGSGRPAYYRGQKFRVKRTGDIGRLIAVTFAAGAYDMLNLRLTNGVPQTQCFLSHDVEEVRSDA